MKDCIQGDVQIARLHLMDIAEQLGSTTTTISTITTNTQLNLHENIHYWCTKCILLIMSLYQSKFGVNSTYNYIMNERHLIILFNGGVVS
jgi:hypothetical protein